MRQMHRIAPFDRHALPDAADWPIPALLAMWDFGEGYPCVIRRAVGQKAAHLKVVHVFQ